MKEKRKVPTKNYYLLGFLLVVSVCLVFYLVNWYQNSQKNKPGFSVIGDVISEFKTDEISNYLLDNPNIVIYFSSSKDENNIEFEKELKKYLLNEEIHNEFIYLDTSEVTNNSFYLEFADKYFDNELKSKNISLNYFPNMAIIKDGKVKDILIKNNSPIKLSEVKELLLKHEVVDK